MQRPSDWWKGVVQSTQMLLERTGTAPGEIAGLALSGASLVSIPVGANGEILLDEVPIWSDMRASEEAKEFFSSVDEEYWYRTTGNGFPPACYSLFKLMWMKKNQPEIYRKTAYVLGSKDYINYRFTGKAATDHSYASGTGAYGLRAGFMNKDFLYAAGVREDLFLNPSPSHTVVGKVCASAARATGLKEGTPVLCGGVDNACMALGAVGPEPGKVYVSLGSSSWIPINSQEPVLDFQKKPYVFSHIQEGMYTSAFSIFSGGSSFRWVKEELCRDIQREKAYEELDKLAEKVPIGANGVIFNPSLAGGTSQDKSVHIRGGYMGLTLRNTRDDLIRAALEGIAMNLKMSLDSLAAHVPVEERILMCGGGSKSRLWMRIFSDIFNKTVYKTNIDQDAASLGAAAIAARGIGWWKDYQKIPQLHTLGFESSPIQENVGKYERLLPIYQRLGEIAADMGDALYSSGF